MANGESLGYSVSTFGVSVQMASGPWVVVRALASDC